MAKRRDSAYEPGRRPGAWQKMRVNNGQEFDIGGYTVGGSTFDALVFGYNEGTELIYAARTRNGFTPKLRASLSEKRAGDWGVGLTAANMEACCWLKPELVGQFEFVEWTEDAHLRHSRFMGLREDKSARDVLRDV